MQNQFSCTYRILPDLLTQQPDCNDCQSKDQGDDMCRAIKNHRSANTSVPHSLDCVGKK